MTTDLKLDLARAIHGTPHATRTSFTATSWAGVERAWEWIGKNYEPKDDSMFLNEYVDRLQKHLGMMRDEPQKPPMKQDNDDQGYVRAFKGARVETARDVHDGIAQAVARAVGGTVIGQAEDATPPPWTAEQREAAAAIVAEVWTTTTELDPHDDDNDLLVDAIRRYGNRFCAAIANVAPIFVSPPPVPSVDGLWRCENCGDAYDVADTRWRMADTPEHACGSIPQCGYFRSRWFGQPSKPVPSVASPTPAPDREALFRITEPHGIEHGWRGVSDAAIAHLAPIVDALTRERDFAREVRDEADRVMEAAQSERDAALARVAEMEKELALRKAEVSYVDEVSEMWRKRAFSEQADRLVGGTKYENRILEQDATIATLTKERDEARSKPRSVTREGLDVVQENTVQQDTETVAGEASASAAVGSRQHTEPNPSSTATQEGCSVSVVATTDCVQRDQPAGVPLLQAGTYPTEDQNVRGIEMLKARVQRLESDIYRAREANKELLKANGTKKTKIARLVRELHEAQHGHAPTECTSRRVTWVEVHQMLKVFYDRVGEARTDRLAEALRAVGIEVVG